MGGLFPRPLPQLGACSPQLRPLFFYRSARPPPTAVRPREAFPVYEPGGRACASRCGSQPEVHPSRCTVKWFLGGSRGCATANGERSTTGAPKRPSAAPLPLPALPSLGHHGLFLSARPAVWTGRVVQCEASDGSPSPAVLPSSVWPSGLPLCWDHGASIHLASVPPWHVLGTGSRTKPRDA